MNKAIGIVIAAVGLVGLAISSIPAVTSMLPFAIPSWIPAKAIVIGGLAFVIVGVVLAFGKGGSGKQKMKEVPIYEGKQIIGYRREK